MIDYAGIGKRIRIIRIANKKTQAKLAEEINISTQYLCMIENNKRKPSLLVLADIATNLNTSIDYLVKGKSTIEKDKIYASNEIRDESYEEDYALTEQIITTVLAMIKHHNS